MQTTRPYGRNDWSDDKALFQAAEIGDMDAVERLLAVGADPERKINGTGECALHACASAGHSEVLLKLIEAGASANVKTGNHWTPLHYACRSGGSETVAALLSAGAHIDAVADPARLFRGRTAEEFLDRTPLHIALSFETKDSYICSEFMEAERDERLKIVKLLAEAGANLDARKTRRNNSLLDEAISDDKYEIIDILLSNGASTETRGDEGRTALITACAYGRAKSVEMLLMAGADPMVENDNGRTALHKALVSKDASGCLRACARLISEEDCRKIFEHERERDGAWGAMEKERLVDFAQRRGPECLAAYSDFMERITARVEAQDFRSEIEMSAGQTQQAQPARRRI